MRPLWIAAGLCSLGLGIAGIVLPVLPTTPFVLLAAFCFSRSSPRLDRWLRDHAVFGQLIADWQTRGAIARRIKVVATVTMAAFLALSIALAFPSAVVLVQAAVMVAVCLFVWSRPDR